MLCNVSIVSIVLIYTKVALLYILNPLYANFNIMHLAFNCKIEKRRMEEIWLTMFSCFFRALSASK